jgi:cell division protein FtsZ
LFEVSEATSIIYEEAGEDANVIFGAVINEELTDEIFITVIATGFNSHDKVSLEPPAQSTDALGSVLNQRNIDLPTFMRNKDARKDESGNQTRKPDTLGDDDIDDLDIPTFLRKQMD